MAAPVVAPSAVALISFLAGSIRALPGPSFAR